MSINESDEETKQDSSGTVIPPKFADDEKITEEIPIQRENTLQRIREDYDEPWKGSIREAIQNGADAYGRNVNDGIVEEKTKLTIEFHIDTSNNTLTYKDNAGGMTQDILENNLLGIDTPDQEKEAGGGAGAYGRGFYVISMCGDGKTYVETRRDDSHICTTVTNVGKHRPPNIPDNPHLSEDIKGTFIHVSGVFDHEIENLIDWAQVETMLLKNFTFLLLSESIQVKYFIDGTLHEPSPPNIDNHLSEGQLIYKEKLPKFSAEGNTYQIRDLYVMRTDVIEEDLPWSGVAMLKGNEYMNHPFMTINPYKPQGIPSLRTPPDMIGWCDATDLCPDLENNAHTSFRGHESKTGIKDILLELHDEHFKKGKTTDEREKLASDIRNTINELLSDYEDFTDYQVNDDDDEAEGRDDDDEKKESTPKGKSLIKCQAGKRYFDKDDEVPLEVQIKNPKDADHERFEIFDLRLSCSEIDFERTLSPKVVEVGQNNFETFDIQTFKTSKEGIYTFEAKIRPEPEIIGIDSEKNEKLDKSSIVFYIGDYDKSSRKKSKSSGSDSEGDNTTNVSFVQDVAFYSKGRDDSWTALASHNDEGGLDLTINAGRAEWKATNRITDNDNKRDMMQRKYGTKWGIEEVILQRNIDEIGEILEGVTIEGEDAAEIIQDKITNRSNKLAQMQASIFESEEMNYED